MITLWDFENFYIKAMLLLRNTYTDRACCDRWTDDRYPEPVEYICAHYSLDYDYCIERQSNLMVVSEVLNFAMENGYEISSASDFIKFVLTDYFKLKYNDYDGSCNLSKSEIVIAYTYYDYLDWYDYFYFEESPFTDLLILEDDHKTISMMKTVDSFSFDEVLTKQFLGPDGKPLSIEEIINSI